MAGSNRDSPVVWPSIRCGDTRALIDFLVAAFGFEEQFSVPGEDGKGIIHAQIRWPGGGGVMLGDAEGGDAFHLFPSLWPGQHLRGDRPARRPPRPSHGRRRHHRPRPPDEDYGSRGFSATDPEGNLWSFGTYAG